MADSRTKRYSVPYNVMLDETHRAMLDQLAVRANVKGSNLVRQWISHAYRMEFEGEPRCMSGQNCLCPRAHDGNRIAPVSDRELLQKHQGHHGTTNGEEA